MSLRKLASGKIPGMAYPGHRHFAKRLLNRRGFLEKSGVTLGVLAAAGLVPELAEPPSKLMAAIALPRQRRFQFQEVCRYWVPAHRFFTFFCRLLAPKLPQSPTSMDSSGGQPSVAWERIPSSVKPLSTCTLKPTCGS